MSQDDITPRRPDYSDEPPPRELNPPPPHDVPPKSSATWVIPVVIVAGVVGVLGCLGCIGVGLLIPAVSKVREAAARTQSSNNLRIIGLAMHNCNDTYKGVPHVSGPWRDPPGDKTERSLFVNLLPFMEQEVLFQNITKGGGNTNYPVKTLISPSDFTGNGTSGECSYAANWQFFQRMAPEAGGERSYAIIPFSMPDGTANTVTYAEIYQNCNGTVRRWGQTGNATVLSTPAFNRMAPVNPSTINTQLQMFQVVPSQTSCSPALAQTPNQGGMLVGLGDASVRSLLANMSLTTWQRACCPEDGNILGMNPNTNDW